MSPRVRMIRAGLVVFAMLGTMLAGMSPAPVLALAPKSQVGPAQRSQISGTIEIAGAPLRIRLNPNGSLQVYHERYTSGAAYGEAGSGFFIAVGSAVYGPFYRQLEAISHDGPSGNGTTGSPFRVVTRLRLNDNAATLEVAQTASYINGRSYFELDWAVTNTGQQQTCFKAYHAADLYFADNDYGIGYYNARTGSVGGFNQARDWFMVFTPRVRATHYEENDYSTIWERVGSAADLLDTINTEYIDNGVALQWDVCLQPGQSTTVGDQWSFGESEAAVIAPGLVGESFRPAGPLEPRITTYIPTPLDISTDPAVIGANLFLAALAMILFTVASELLNRTLAENEAFFQRLIRPLKWIDEWAQRASLSKRLGRPLWFELVKLAGVMLIYGFVFSLLDASWNPLSLTGLYLFITMTIAFGIVGLADDLVQWLTARRWKLPVSLSIRPGNLLTIVASTTFSRAFTIVPGIMFGAPEAFDIDAAALDRRKENSLLRLAAGVLFAILLASWLPTVLTALLQRAGLPLLIGVVVSGWQSFLLLIFAVTVQNIFLQMLRLPGTIGRALARWNRLAWAAAFLGAAFLFYHTLLNPQGDLTKALASTNVRFFFATIGLFLIFTLLVWLFFKAANARASKPAGSQPIAGPQPLTLEVQNLVLGWRAFDPAGREAALQRVAAYGPAVIPQALAYLGHPDPAVRQAAIVLIERVGDVGCIQILQPSQNDPDPSVRETARWALDRLYRQLPPQPYPPVYPAAAPPHRSSTSWVWVVLILLAGLCCLCLIAFVILTAIHQGWLSIPA